MCVQIRTIIEMILGMYLSNFVAYLFPPKTSSKTRMDGQPNNAWKSLSITKDSSHQEIHVLWIFDHLDLPIHLAFAKKSPQETKHIILLYINSFFSFLLGIDASGDIFLLDRDVPNLKVGRRRRGRKKEENEKRLVGAWTSVSIGRYF